MSISVTVRAKKPVVSKKPQAYDPLAPSFKNPSQLNGAAQKQAQAVIQPDLDANTSQANTANQASATRQAQLQGWYGWAGDRLGAAFKNAQDAANQLIATRNAGSAGEQDTLAAALAGNQGKTNALATQLGGAPAPNQDADVLRAAMGQGDAANQGVFDTTTAQTLGAGERVGTAAVGGLQAGAAEQARLLAQTNQLTSDRNAITARLPDLINTARTQLGQTEETKANDRAQRDIAIKQLGETKANRLFQQYLAEQNLSLSARQENFQEWLGKQNLNLSQSKQAHQVQIDWANINLNKEQVDNQRVKLNQAVKDAKGKKNAQTAQLRAQQYNNGLSLLNDFLTPAPGEGAPHQQITYKQGDVGQTLNGVQVTPQMVGTPMVGADGKPIYPKVNTEYQPRSYGRALQILRGQAGMSLSDALRLLRTSNDIDWRRAAANDILRIKRRTRKTGSSKGVGGGIAYSDSKGGRPG